MRSVIAVLKLTTFVLASMVTLIVQSTVLFFTKGPKSMVYASIFHRQCTRIMNIKIIVEGEVYKGLNTVYIGNHISYMDIATLGGIMPGAFIAKKEIEGWPLFGILGKMGRTI